MTVLTALKAHYDRLADRGEVPAFGYSMEGIGFALILSPEGEVVGNKDLRNPSDKKKLVAQQRPVPQSFKRPGVTPRSFFLWDKSQLVLGLGTDKAAGGRARFDGHLAAFRELHLRLLAGTDDEGLLAFRRFVERWSPDDFAPPLFDDEMLDQNLAFMLKDDVDGNGRPRFIHDRPAARLIWERQVAEAAGLEEMCLVTGHVAPVARLHPAIKGVWGAQTSGASLVSFNLDAFESYGKAQGANAPVSEAAAFGYGTALNTLLARDSRNRVQVADTSTVFWADAAVVGETAARNAEVFVHDRLAPPPPPETGEKTADERKRLAKEKRADQGETARLRDLALVPAGQGRALSGNAPDLRPDTRFYILGLAPNSARLSVRFWHDTTLGSLRDCLDRHGKDLAIDPPAWRSPPSVQALLYETALQRKAENIPKQLGGEVMRAILTGGRYPRSLLAAAILRIRADGEISGRRAAICKACIARDFRKGFEKEDVPVGLDRTQQNPAYRLGRLFAVLEGVQRAALGKVNATIRDRYFGAASATPSSVFPLLLRGANHHLSVLRKKNDTGRLAVWFEGEIGAILADLNMDLPRHLRLEDQGRFAVGYYHQRYAAKAPAGAAETVETVETVETEAPDDTTETRDEEN
jgi:CRISPR-associated protein Csd1